MKKRDNVQSANIAKPSILGTFEGECADSNITNANGLDITRDVWENVFSSDEYAKSIENGWYIGFLGHPEDPACQDFEHACIVMTEGSIDESGKIHGKFNLIDTPVGRIVKSFIDGGVTFGISVRGAGDIIDNSVDPDTFIFRGFDLVAFPAYPDAIPTFTEIAASSDIEKQKKYKAICASVNANINSLNTKEAVEIIQSQFAKQSEEYKKLDARKQAIESSESLDLSKEKLNSVTELYIEASEKNRQLIRQNSILRKSLRDVQASANRKISVLRRITAAQQTRLESSLDAANNQYKTVKASSNKLKSENESLKNFNLKYKQRVESSLDSIKSKDSVIASLQSKLDETVTQLEDMKSKTSNRDAVIENLKKKIEATTTLVKDYQDAYAALYATALGTTLDGVKVTSSTSVQDLRSIIKQKSNKQPVVASSDVVLVDTIDDHYDDSGLVTL